MKVYRPDYRDTLNKAKLYSAQKKMSPISIALQEIIALGFTTICICLFLE